MELNDTGREMKSTRRVRKRKRESFIVGAWTCPDTGKLLDGDSLWKTAVKTKTFTYIIGNKAGQDSKDVVKLHPNLFEVILKNLKSILT